MTARTKPVDYIRYHTNIRHDYTLAMLEYHMEDSNWSKILGLPSDEQKRTDTTLWMKTFGIPEGTEEKRADGDESWAKYFGIPTLEESDASDTSKSANWDSVEVPSIHD